MSDMAAQPSAPAELPRAKTDWLPLLLIPALGLLALPNTHVPAAREAILAALGSTRFAGEAASLLSDDE